MSINNGLFTSNTDLWATPQRFFDELNREFGFTRDVCALSENAKCDQYYSPAQDGLSQDWQGICWMNPPYGNPEHPCRPNCNKKACQKRGYHIDKYSPGIRDWMKKAYESSLNGATVVCLVPARTDAAWWHDYCMKADDIRFVRGRLKFGGAKWNAPFPNAVVIFDGKTAKEAIA